jgi:hypothetical protein
MEIIRKPQQAPTDTVSVRVDVTVKKDFTRAREVAARQNIDLTAMVSAALGDIAKAVLGASTSKVTSITGSGSTSS